MLYTAILSSGETFAVTRQNFYLLENFHGYLPSFHIKAMPLLVRSFADQAYKQLFVELHNYMHNAAINVCV